MINFVPQVDRLVPTILTYEINSWFDRFWKRVSRTPREKGQKDDGEKDAAASFKKSDLLVVRLNTVSNLHVGL